jgi:signal recognition particle receptor subunit beta
MPTVQHAEKQLFLKVVYYGTGMCGKTTNLKYLHGVTRPEYRGKLLSVDTVEDRTLFFDLMPVELGSFKGYSVRLHLCTVPGQEAFHNTRRLILRGADGVVFVADSQRDMLLANQRSMVSLRVNLHRHGLDPTQLPMVVQYNKRDLPDIIGVAELRQALGIAPGIRQIEASASVGYGVSSTLKAINSQALEGVADPRALPEGRSASIIPGVRPSMMPQAAPPISGFQVQAAKRGQLIFPRPAAVPTFVEDEQTAPLPMAKVS